MDRYIPRMESDSVTRFNLSNEKDDQKQTSATIPQSTTTTNTKSDQNSFQNVYHAIMRTEITGVASTMESPLLSASPGRSPQSNSILTFSPQKKKQSDVVSMSLLSPVSQRLLLTPRKATRVITKTPYKVLDAPELQDDFYLNLVDWSTTNLLGVGLGSCVYLWSALSSQVTKLCELPNGDTVTSVNWNPKGTHVSVGTSKGVVELWDAARGKKVRSIPGHESRIGSLGWNNELLSSGSRDRVILTRDMRSPSSNVYRSFFHKQEVCGLKWSPDGRTLASGGNDNKLLIWDQSNSLREPIHVFREHKAAVKAISWSPFKSELLASGGGTADRRIRFWNTQTGTSLNEIDTGSQVCNLAWSKNANEIVSTHGYSQNQIIVWKVEFTNDNKGIPSMEQIAVLTGHSMRVLYLSTSPDSQNIATGAGDETLRFWSVFTKPHKSRHKQELVR